MIRLSRRYSFPASHRLFCPRLTEEQNRDLYGKCANPFGHGHDYDLEVTVQGTVNAVTGRVVDLSTLDALVDRQVLSRFRYKNLNEEIEAFRTAVPTTENLASEVDRLLRLAWRETFGSGGPSLQKLRIWETERNICEVGKSE